MSLSHSRVESALPVPDREALAVSQELSTRIAAEIARHGGWLSFARYMEMALYEPGLGYYSNPGQVFGAAGDFVTAPELTPLFGATLARQVSPWLKDPALAGSGQVVLEVGGGSGMLAAQLLNALDNVGHHEVRYLILELSAERREHQRQTLKSLAPGLMDRVGWLETFPESFAGVVLANELLDAMPVQLFEWQADAEADLQEMGVAWVDGQFAWAPRPADAVLTETVTALRNRLGPEGAQWHSPYRSEVCPAQQAWMRTLADCMTAGVVMLLDYGFAEPEYYHPQRDQGTLMCHYRHRSHADPFLWPGLSDITAHVDFTALARAATAEGFSLVGYTSMAAFLLNAGLLDELADLPREPESFWFAQAQAVQQLISEAEMGELFKVIAFEKNLREAASVLGFGGNRVV
ncbi:SAM-dependent methyltransferase [Lautropia mirabilis]|uniref:class I SAM-dependent methyltransferase n=1 Tax=Lautropia mirabilis TaxID=47671 RepID=UPI0028890E32|nr:SAM-dependent methyltransferase [Lautropia mirabilis]